MKNNLFPIAKQGWKPLAFTAIAFYIAFLFDFDFLQFLFFVAFLFLLYIYRNPERLVPHFQDSSVISPVDGVVISIEEIEDAEYSYAIQIESSYLDVAVLRLPFASVHSSFVLQRGTRLSARHSLSFKLNENAHIIFEDKDQNKLKVIHRLKQSFAALDIDLDEGKELAQGMRYGLMLQGTTTLLLPQNFRMNIKLGDELIAGDHLIGYFTKR